jgi:hypothetical protein
VIRGGTTLSHTHCVGHCTLGLAHTRLHGIIEPAAAAAAAAAAAIGARRRRGNMCRPAAGSDIHLQSRGRSRPALRACTCRRRRRRRRRRHLPRWVCLGAPAPRLRPRLELGLARLGQPSTPRLHTVHDDTWAPHALALDRAMTPT